MFRLTHSAAQCYRTCPRRYQHEYILQRIKIVEAAPLTMGRAWHLAVAAYWQASADRQETALAASQWHLLDPQVAAQLCAMLANYAPPCSDYFVRSVEEAFEIPIINPETGRAMKDAALCGRSDGVLVRNDGACLVLEHKTTSEDVIGYGPYWQRLSIDHQITGYAIAARATGALYDVVRKPTLKFCAKDADDYGVYTTRCIEQRTDSAEWHQYRTILIDAEQQRECMTDLWQLAHQIRDCARLGTWPRNSGACKGFFGICPYLDVCTGAARLDDDTIFRSKIDAHEELL